MTKTNYQVDLFIGKRVRRRRRLLGMTQQQLAEAVGIRFQQIQKYECGANRIVASRLFELSVALNVPIEYFFEGIPRELPVQSLPDVGTAVKKSRQTT
jgi:transcriptional regulator with XRE-family HTH domain